MATYEFEPQGSQTFVKVTTGWWIFKKVRYFIGRSTVWYHAGPNGTAFWRAGTNWEYAISRVHGAWKLNRDRNRGK